MKKAEPQWYPFALKIGEDFTITCDVVEQEGTAFTVSSANVTFYDEDKTSVLTKADSDDDFTIDGDQLKYKIEVASDTFSEGVYTVKWDYTDSAANVMIEEFLVRVIAVP